MRKPLRTKKQFDAEVAQNAHQRRQRGAVKAKPIEADVDLKDQQDGDGRTTSRPNKRRVAVSAAVEILPEPDKT